PAGKDFPITDFGAVPDGKTLNTAAIQKAIDTCSDAGGGTVVVPHPKDGGFFLSGALFLKKGVHLRVDKDAILKASINPADYPIVDSRFEGTERPFMAAFINATNLDGITLSGEGTIDGSGDQWLTVNTRGPRAARAGSAGSIAPATAPTTAPLPENIAPVPPLQNTFTTPRTVLTPTPDNPPAMQIVGAGSNRPRLMLLTNCTNTVVKDLHLQNQAVWCLHILYCTDVLVDNVTILDPNHRVPSSDGIDIDSSQRVRVNKTTISVNDDCISIKSGKDADGRRVNRPCEQILIVNSHMAEGQGGVAMGSEVSGTIRNVEVRDTIVDSGNWAPIRFKSQDTRGGTVENIVYRNLKIANVRQIFDFNLNWSSTSRSGPRMPTTVRNVYIINVTGTATGGGAILGLPDSPITNIVFKDCDLTANSPVRLTNTANLDTAGLKLKVPNGPAFITNNNATTQPRPAPAPQSQPASPLQ
ncbi:MAG TPA: glycoside hydrolase family 28 protein, partial [Phycisphaerae bacterium]|nr:glycoside hydrolase family 28 protein [Phycisphaerae bacterium]